MKQSKEARRLQKCVVSVRLKAKGTTHKQFAITDKVVYQRGMSKQF